MAEMFLFLLLSPIEDEEERRALARLYEKYHNHVFKSIRRWFHLNREAAEDCTQQSYLKVARNIRTVAALSSRFQRVYLLKTAHSVASDYVSKKQRLRFVDIWDDDLDKLAYAQGKLFFLQAETVVEDRELLRAFIKRLPELTQSEQVVYQLYFVENLSREEVAKRMNISIDSVRTYVSRTRLHLEKLLEEVYNAR